MTPDGLKFFLSNLLKSQIKSQIKKSNRVNPSGFMWRRPGERDGVCRKRSCPTNQHKSDGFFLGFCRH